MLRSQRSELMSRVRVRHTAPEIALRRALHAAGLRYRLHTKDLPGRPDIVFPGKRVAVFVHGCFWHGCDQCDRGLRRPKTNTSYWANRLAENRARDRASEQSLLASGWRVTTVWECETRDASRLASAVVAIRDRVRGSGGE